jgi:hypothetical protein
MLIFQERESPECGVKYSLQAISQGNTQKAGKKFTALLRLARKLSRLRKTSQDLKNACALQTPLQAPLVNPAWKYRPDGLGGGFELFGPEKA